MFGLRINSDIERAKQADAEAKIKVMEEQIAGLK